MEKVETLRLTVASRLRSSGTAALESVWGSSCWDAWMDKRTLRNFNWEDSNWEVCWCWSEALTVSQAPSGHQTLLSPRCWFGSPSGDWENRNRSRKISWWSVKAARVWIWWGNLLFYFLLGGNLGSQINPPSGKFDWHQHPTSGSGVTTEWRITLLPPALHANTDQIPTFQTGNQQRHLGMNLWGQPRW